MKTGFFGRHSYIIMFFTICLLCFSLVFFGFLNGDVKKKETELEQLSEYYDSVLEKNNELSYLLNDADENELFEQLARSHGYAYPDEKIYLDITPGK